MPQFALPFLSFLSGAVALDGTPALFDARQGRKAVTYGDLRAQLSALLPLFHNGPRGLVLGAPPRTSAGLVAFLAAAAAGHAVLLADPASMRLEPLIAAYEPDWLFAPPALRPEGSFTPLDWPLDDLGLWRRVGDPQAPPHPDLSLLLLTSNPQEEKQAVRLSYANLETNLIASLKALGLNGQERILAPMPLSYSLGLQAFLLALSAGASAILTEEDFKSRAFWDLAREREASLFAGVPLHYDFIVRAGLESLHAPRLKSFWLGGGRLPLPREQEALRQIKAREGRFFYLYGRAETAPRMALLPLHERPDKIGSIGRALEGGRFTLEQGYLVYHGPNVMMGYASSRADLGEGDWMGGTFNTGEAGKIDEEGFVFLGGRKDP